MCLWAQGIDKNNGGGVRLRRACVLINDYGGVSRGKGIYDASEGLETTIEAARIRGKRWRLKRRDDGPEEMATTVEVSASAEKDEPKDSTTMTEASAEEAEETMCLRERL